MKKRIINYRLKIDNLLDNPDKISKEEWKRILQELSLIHISEPTRP